jgi:hypothetical protein
MQMHPPVIFQMLSRVRALSMGPNVCSSLYSVVTGNNNYCSSSQASNAVYCQAGFPAATGWDPTTGWGSITLPALANITGLFSPLTASPTPHPTRFEADDDVSGDSKQNESLFGLSVGAEAGIAVGVVVAVLIGLGLLVFRFCIYAKGPAAKYSAPISQPALVVAHQMQPLSRLPTKPVKGTRSARPQVLNAI